MWMNEENFSTVVVVVPRKSQQRVLPWQATASNRKHREMKERERSKATVAPTAPTMPADGAQEQKLEEKALCFDSAEMCLLFQKWGPIPALMACWQSFEWPVLRDWMMGEDEMIVTWSFNILELPPLKTVPPNPGGRWCERAAGTLVGEPVSLSVVWMQHDMTWLCLRNVFKVWLFGKRLQLVPKVQSRQDSIACSHGLELRIGPDRV